MSWKILKIFLPTILIKNDIWHDPFFFSFYFQFLIILTVLPILTYSIPAPDYSDSTLDPAEIQVPEDLYDQSRTKRSGFDIGALKQVRI